MTEVEMKDAHEFDRMDIDTGHNYEYDLVVIGGGSGGLSCAKEAARLGKKVALLDFVKPTIHDTSWGLGGTCVNVGCIPKKLMHQSALLGESLKDAKKYGWEFDDPRKHNWERMVDAIQDHISSLNWGYRAQLREKQVKYLNAYGVFVDPHTIEATERSGEKVTLTARRFLIATGGRPQPGDFPGSEKCISSDDLFSRRKPPGKTLIVGASYVSLECAGFVAGFGYDTTIMVRSILLRGFDQQISEQIGEYMSHHAGIKFIRPAVPKRLDALPDGKLKVTYTQDGKDSADEFDTVMLAIGRAPETKGIGLEKIGVKLTSQGKIPGIDERSNVSHIYAIGDIYTDIPTGKSLELTPVAIKAGILLARRLYDGSTIKMDYVNVPTTVFTPIEYGCVGLSEEDAEKQIGKDNLEIYHAYYQPLEWTVAERPDDACYLKVLVDKTNNEKIVGYHILGPNAGECTQGFAAAMHRGMNKQDLDATVGIHPTVAEEATTMNITKRSGTSAKKTGC